MPGMRLEAQGKKVKLLATITYPGSTFTDILIGGVAFKIHNERLFKAMSGEDLLLFKDKCSVCNGTRGGMLGNENVIGGQIMCDYCTIDEMDKRKQTHQQEEQS